MTWRIVSLFETQPTAQASPFTTMTGAIHSIDSLTANNTPKSVTVLYEGDNGGLYDFPPQSLPSAFIEVQTAQKIAALLPTFNNLLRKRQREDTGGDDDTATSATSAALAVTKSLVEAIKDEEIKKKRELAPGLKLIDDDSRTWFPFAIASWVERFRAQITEGGRQSLATAWKVDLMACLTNHGVDFTVGHGTDAITRDTHLKTYNDARDAYELWLTESHTRVLATKRQWELGFRLLFALMSSIAGLMHGFKRALQLKNQCTAEFDKASTLLDISQMMGNIFRAGRQGGNSTPHDRHNSNKFGGRQGKPGTDQPTGAAGEIKCKFCNKYHVPQNPRATGKELWSGHRCRQQ